MRQPTNPSSQGTGWHWTQRTLKDFEFASSKYRSSRQSERQEWTPLKQRFSKLKPIVLPIKAITYPIRRNKPRLHTNKRILKQTLINMQPRQTKNQLSSRKKVLHKKNLSDNLYSNKNETDRGKLLWTAETKEYDLMIINSDKYCCKGLQSNPATKAPTTK